MSMPPSMARRSLARMLGDHARADALADAAEKLRQRFEEKFWCEDLGTYAIALDGDKKPCRVRTSNAGQVLCLRHRQRRSAPRGWPRR